MCFCKVMAMVSCWRVGFFQEGRPVFLSKLTQCFHLKTVLGLMLHFLARVFSIAVLCWISFRIREVVRAPRCSFSDILFF